MIAHLVIDRIVFDLHPSRDDARCRYHIPVLLLPEWAEHPSTAIPAAADYLPPAQDIVDGFAFRLLRDRLGARISTDDPRGVCQSLGVPQGEPGVDLVEIEHD